MKNIYTGDCETDPFEYNRMVTPFVWGFFDGQDHQHFWGADCTQRFVEYISRVPAGYIYIHNGGKFDFVWLVEYASGDLKIINSRIVEMRIGNHILRDSYAIMPFALSVYKKTPIDYNKMLKDVREKHRAEIIHYLRDDCTDLYTLVTAFVAEFGNKLTVGGTAMNQLKKFHEFEVAGPSFDACFRQDYYYGGRVQCFETGIIKRPLKIYDVNSMYPHVMNKALHPVGIDREISDKIESNTCFVCVEGWNRGAFPTRMKNGTLDFTVPFGTFHVTIHEYEAAIATNTFRQKRIVKTIGFDYRITFADFVTHFYDERKKAKSAGDRIHDIFYKFVLNSAYGKFAQNPENFFEYKITPFGIWLDEPCPVCKPNSDTPADPLCTWCDGYGTYWLPDSTNEGKYIIWRCPTTRKSYYNIATGASITGAARAMLLRGIAAARRPVYCDTDSIICESLNAPSDADTLGAWKLEGSGNMAAICGKKLYAVFNGVECIKKAHKGGNLSPAEILRIARGDTVESRSPVPNFKWSGKHQFTSRRFKMTA